ncbi:sensor histidine kinase [Lysobacter enzymogenes]|uniref:histidine kinase n=1 Tax=Lysobacter enzymogenes TaxID=69 RepID=A0AAU9AJN4_LYSEN|nr:ATP-binding protein [Lysobacter enzymogenes]BAV96578.1 two-component system, NtrC family, sensor histidine kinase PilS [Lysobacter enzymogenes]
MPSGLAPVTPADADSALRRELYFFTLYRLLEAALLVLFLFGPVDNLIAEPRHDLFARSLSLSYLFIAGLLFVFGRRGDLRAHVFAGIACDLFFGVLSIHALPGAGTGIALMLMFNVGAAALLLPTRFGIGAAIVACLGLIGEWLWTELGNEALGRTIAEPVMFALGYLSIALLTNTLGRQMRESQELAERRGAEAANYAEINELIIRRMRTGVLLVDGEGRLRLANEAAMLLLGDNGEHNGSQHGHRVLAIASPELSRRLGRWRVEGRPDESPLRLAPDLPEVVPRFTRLLAGSDQTLIFLDDTSLVSRRAESITLAALGRFSASLAHEIRNPLAAINYAVQLLEESRDIAVSDRRLLEIIRQQGSRMNGIVENVLGMARREPAKPEHVELMSFVRQFVEEYRASHPIEQDTLRATGAHAQAPALVDPRQLHQALTVLVHNALTYGRQPGEPARVSVHVYFDEVGLPAIDVLDRGPGIPDSVAERLFRPFFTTSAHGTGLGLYIARELCRANQASLDYVAVPGGGGCFRIRLAGASALASV